MNKTISFGIPCYNSADYMDHCITSILEGAEYAEDIEIIIVNDGSTKDNTPEKADEWAAKYPNLIKAVHQENGGHGMAVLAGLHHATGLYYKVVDSDDWVDHDALQAVLAFARTQLTADKPVDLIISNYVYEHVNTETHNVISYTHELPQDKVFTWDEIGRFRPDQNLLMHALMYRREVLLDGDLPLPAHTFYVDNIYAYVPLPRVERLYYLNVDLYRYFIGREDQSVNEEVMVSRIDQQLRITRIMTDEFHLYEDVKSEKLRAYMINYLTIMYAICSIFSRLSDDPKAMDNVEDLWEHLKTFDPHVYKKVRYGIIGVGTNLPGRLGVKMSIGFYRVAQKLVKFN